MIILVFGPPGSGKTTIAEHLAQKYSLNFISLGKILREMAQTDPELRDTLNSGQLMPNDRVDDLLFKKMEELGHEIILDGYPRTLDQAESFERYLSQNGLVINKIYRVKIPFEVVLERSVRRGRADDKPDVIKERFEIYNHETDLVLKFFEHTGMDIIEVDNTKPLNEVKKFIDDSIEKL